MIETKTVNIVRLITDEHCDHPGVYLMSGGDLLATELSCPFLNTTDKGRRGDAMEGCFCVKQIAINERLNIKAETRIRAGAWGRSLRLPECKASGFNITAEITVNGGDLS